MEATAELSKLKERLAAAEAKAALLDVLPTPLMQLDKEGTIAYLNPAGAAVLGLNRQHVVGMNCHNVLQTPQCRTGQCLCQQAVTATTTLTGETIVDPAGLNVPIRFMGKPITDAAGNAAGAVVTLVDIRNELELTAEFLRLQTAVAQGDLTARGDAEKFTGHAHQLVQTVNTALDAMTEPLQLATEYVGRIAQGDPPDKIAGEYHGAFNELKNHLNHWLEVWNDLLADVTELSQATVRGNLAVRADLAKYQGDWLTLLKGVNETVEAMHAPLREVGNVLDKMAAGDLKTRITTEYRGDYQVLKTACNELGSHFLGVREALTDLQTAIGNGQLDARCNPYQFKGEFAALALSCNAVLDAVSGPLKLMTEYVAHFAQGALPPKIIDAYKGDFNGMKHNLNSLIDTLQGLTNAADAISNGDLTVQLPKRTEEDRLIRAFQQIMGNFRQFTAEMDNLTEAANAGRLDVRGSVGELKGDWAKIVRRVNAMLDAISAPLNVAAQYVERLASGVLPAKITDEYQGAFGEIKNSLNHCIEAFNSLIAETAAMTEAAAKGDWGRRGDVSKYAGGWALIVKGMNQTVEHLMTPLLDFGSVLNRMADGDLNARITADCKGDYNALRLTCNGLSEQFQGVQANIEKLKTRALNGRFDLRGEPQQFKGEFAGMVRGLNDLLDAVSSPLDVMTEQAARLAQGALPEKLTGQYKGNFQTIKNELNALLETLTDVTRFAEQMALGKLTPTLKERSAQDALCRSLNAMQGTIRNVLRETRSQVQTVQSGRLDIGRNTEAFPGSWRDLVNDVNSVIETFSSPLQSLTTYLDRLAQGELPEKITGEYQGMFHKLKTTVNTVIDETSAVMQIAQEIANGNHNVTVAERSERDTLRQTFKKMVGALQAVSHVPAKTANLPALALEKEADGAVMPGSEQDGVSQSLRQMMSNFQAMMGEMEKSVTEVQQQTWLRAGQTELGKILRKEQNDAALAKDLLNFLVNYVKAQVGAVYLAQPEHDTVTLRLASSYAYNRRKGHKVEFMLGEGLVGQAALEQENILFSDIPDDYMWVSSGLGKAPLRYLLVTPLISGGELKGVIELGTVHEFTELHLSFLDHVREHIALALHATQTRAKLREPLEAVQRQTAELHQQQAFLQARAEELEAQTRLFQEAQQTLRQQQVQLHRTQAELDAQARNVQEAENALREQQAQFQLNQTDLQARAWALREAKQELRQQQEQLCASQEDLELRSQAIQATTQKLQQQQEYLQGCQADLDAQAEKLRTTEQTLQQQQQQFRLRQEEVETLSRNLHEYEQKLLRQRDQLQQKEAELARRVKEFEKYREALKEKSAALEKAQQLVKEKIRELDLSGKYKPEFLANLSHKLRTSLNRLLILSNLLVENKDCNLTARQVELARTMNTAVTKLLALSNEALHLAKVETGKIELRFEDVHLQELVAYIEQNFAQLAAEKGLDLQIAVAAGLPDTIRTDRQQVMQILRHLLLNAIKFTEQGRVRVQLGSADIGADFAPKRRLPPNAFTIAVADSGIGIPKHKQRVIFEAFQQVDNALTRKYGGIGLGLALARGLARLLDGEIEVLSTEGRGSIFTLYLPESLPPKPVAPFPHGSAPETTLAYAPAAIPAGAAAAPIAATASPPALGLAEQDSPVETTPATPTNTVKRMLIVENDGLTLMSMVELLSGSGIEITTVETGQDAYRQLQTMPFDCLILDLNLTDLTGIELLDMIEADPLIAPLPIVVYADREFTREEKQLFQRYTKSSLLIEVNSQEHMLAEITMLLQPPALDLPAESQPPLRLFQGKDTVLDQKTILMVDPGRSPDGLVNVLQEKGLHILQAGNGEEALQQLAAHPEVDLVLMDLMPPEMNGDDVTRKIRKEPRFMKLPIIALTGKTLDDDRQKCLTAGVNDYLAQPVDTDELLSLLRVWLY